MRLLGVLNDHQGRFDKRHEFRQRTGTGNMEGTTWANCACGWGSPVVPPEECYPLWEQHVAAFNEELRLVHIAIEAVEAAIKGGV